MTPIKKESGLTLLELLLALAILPIILLGTTAMERSMVRVQAGNMAASEIQNQLSFAYRSLEKDFENASLVMIDRMPDPAQGPVEPWYQWRIRPIGGSAAGTDDVNYEIDLRSQSSSVFRKYNEAETQEFVVPGNLELGSVRDPAAQTKVPVWFSPDFKMLTLNLAAKSTLPQGSIVKMRGYSKSFFIRTALISDCRSGTCV